MLDYHDEVFEGPVSTRVSRKTNKRKSSMRKSHNENKRNYNNLRKARDIIKVINGDGWVLVRQSGSHRHYKHAVKSGVVTVAGRLGQDLPQGTRNSILNQAGLKG